MTPVTIQEAQARLPELIADLKPGDELYITQDEHTVARLTVEPPELDKPRTPGIAAGKLIILSEDDAHLEDFKEYMPS